MGVGLTMLSLTKAQRELVDKAKVGPVRAFHSEWPVFYRLKSAGVLRYSDNSGNEMVELTPEARKFLYP